MKKKTGKNGTMKRTKRQSRSASGTILSNGMEFLLTTTAGCYCNKQQSVTVRDKSFDEMLKITDQG
jgi:hypothetical protein